MCATTQAGCVQQPKRGVCNNPSGVCATTQAGCVQQPKRGRASQNGACATPKTDIPKTGCMQRPKYIEVVRVKIKDTPAFTYDEGKVTRASYYLSGLHRAKRRGNGLSDFGVLLPKISLPLVTKLADVLVEGIKPRVPCEVE